MTEPYHERIALRTMQQHYVEQIVKVARARQVKLMGIAENAIAILDAALSPDTPSM
jgi:hypothetical protein